MNDPAIDPDVFDEISELMDEEMGDFIETYLENSPMLLKQINQAMVEGDLKTLYGHAHQLRGSSGSIGAMQVFQLATELEQKAKAGELGSLGGLVVKLQVAFEQAEKELKMFL